MLGKRFSDGFEDEMVVVTWVDPFDRLTRQIPRILFLLLRFQARLKERQMYTC